MSSFCREDSQCTSPTSLKALRRRPEGGFALFFVLVLLGAVSLFLAMTGTHGLLDQRILKAQEQEAKAKDIALFALDMALAHLEHSLGPNGRTSTVPYPYPGLTESYYTAAWKQEPTELAEKAVCIGYLVPPPSNEGCVQFFQDSLEIRVPLVPLPEGEGYYSYWIGDEGVKAKLNLGSSLRKTQNTSGALIDPKNLEDLEEIATKGLGCCSDYSRYSDWSSLARGLHIDSETVKKHYPHFTLKSYGLLGQAISAGSSSTFYPKKNLNALGASHPASTPEPNHPPNLQERLIQDFHQLGQSVHLGQSIDLDPSPHISPKPFAIQRDSPYAPAELEGLGIGPICAACRLRFDFDLMDSNTLAIYEGMQILLWNPYAVALDNHRYTLSLVCNKKPSIALQQAALDKSSEQWVDLGQPNLEERGYPYTILKAKLSTTFLAGQKKAFVLKNTSLDPLQPDLHFEEIPLTTVAIGTTIDNPFDSASQATIGNASQVWLNNLPRVWLKNEPYLLEATAAPLLKDTGLHAKRQVRRQRVQNPYTTKESSKRPEIEQSLTLPDTSQGYTQRVQNPYRNKDPKAKPGTEQKLTLSDTRQGYTQRSQDLYKTKKPSDQPGIEQSLGQSLTVSETRQVLGKTRETPSWPDMVLRIESAEKDYEPKTFLFHELSLASLSLKPLVLEQGTTDSKDLRSAHLEFEYRLNFRPEMPFQNNPRAFLPPRFIPSMDATWEWSWRHNPSSSLKDLRPIDLSPLALFDLSPLTSIGKLRHLLVSLDPNAPLYATQDPILNYWDTSYCPHRLISQKGKQTVLEGAFNVNSRSIAAWKSVLLTALAPEIQPGGTFSRTNFNSPTYTIHPDQAASLAAHIVELLNAAPPYFSLSSFISAGILDKALDKLNLPYQEHPLLALRSFDILDKIGPLLAPSSDTFMIRAQGASFIKMDSIGKPIYLKASCEALVQRVLEHKEAEAGSAVEKRFRVLHLRWVEADKL